MVIKVRRGLKNDFIQNQPFIDVGEFVFFTDTKELYIGGMDDNDNPLLVPIVTEKNLYPTGNYSVNAQYDLYNQEVSNYFDMSEVKSNLGSLLYSVLSKDTYIYLYLPQGLNGPEIEADVDAPNFTTEYFLEIAGNTNDGNQRIEVVSLGLNGIYNQTINNEEISVYFSFVFEFRKTLVNGLGFNGGEGQTIEEYTGITAGDLTNAQKYPNISAQSSIFIYATVDGDDYVYDDVTEANIAISFNEVRESEFLRKKELETFDKLIDIAMPPLRVKYAAQPAPDEILDNLPGIPTAIYNNSNNVFWAGTNVYQRLMTLKNVSGGYTFYGDSDTGMFSYGNSSLSDYNSLTLQTGGTSAIGFAGTSSSVNRVRRDITVGSGFAIIGPVVPNRSMRTGSSPSLTVTNLINQNTSTYFGGGGILVFNTATNATLTIPPYYKTASQVVDNNSTDLQFRIGSVHHVSRIGSGTVTVDAGANIVDGATTYRTRFAIEGQAGLATSFQIPLYGKVTLTLIQGNAGGLDHIWLVEGNVTNVVLA